MNLDIEIEFPFLFSAIVSFAIRKCLTVFRSFHNFLSSSRDGDFHNGWLRNDALWNLL